MVSLPEGEGIRLLTDDAAAEHAGTDAPAVRHWAEMGLISQAQTPAGPRYRRDEIDALLADPGRALVPARWIRPGSAASILGVGAKTITKAANERRVSVRRAGRDRRYSEREIYHIRAERERLRDPLWWPPPRTD
jgi:hypothetical protein